LAAGGDESDDERKIAAKLASDRPDIEFTMATPTLRWLGWDVSTNGNSGSVGQGVGGSE
jgi:hypothetical protein